MPGLDWRVSAPSTPSGESSSERGVLFTAFEPSGDQHAAVVIRELRARRPDLPVYAWGGPQMERAGATIIEQTGGDAIIGMPGLRKILDHRAMHKRIVRWARANRPLLHIPVDSPAANFPICKALRRQGTTVVHLVAPQLWAWGSWRISKLRRDTSHVLCLLPFEEEWFRSRDVPASFIGHPLFDHDLDAQALDDLARKMPEGGPRICLLPGSRPGELRGNFPLLLEAFERLRAKYPDLVGVVPATNEAAAQWLREHAERGRGWPEGLDIVADQTDAAIRWSDVCLVASGTVTLQIARHARPMVVFYRANPLMYSLLGRWLIEAEFLTLPNLIAGREIVPEFVPHFGDATRLVEATERLLRDDDLRARQQAALAAVCARFDGIRAGPAAVDRIERFLSPDGGGSG